MERVFTVILEDNHSGKNKFGVKCRVSSYDSFIRSGRNVEAIEQQLDSAFRKIKECYMAREKFIQTMYRLGVM